MPGILMRGLSHRRAGLACQDAGAIVVKNGVRIMALSDGCSASKYATQAAYANIKAILTMFCAVRLDVFLALPELMQRIAVIGYAAREIALTAGKIGDHHRRDYAATLIFSVQDAAGRTLLGHLGDGEIFAARASGLPLYRSYPEPAAGGSTYFTVSPDAVEHLRLMTPDAVEKVLLTTDGAANGLPLAETPEMLQCLFSAVSDRELSERVRALGGDHTDDWGILTAAGAVSGSEVNVPRPDQQWEHLIRSIKEGMSDA